MGRRKVSMCVSCENTLQFLITSIHPGRCSWRLVLPWGTSTFLPKLLTGKCPFRFAISASRCHSPGSSAKVGISPSEKDKESSILSCGQGGSQGTRSVKPRLQWRIYLHGRIKTAATHPGRTVPELCRVWRQTGRVVPWTKPGAIAAKAHLCMRTCLFWESSFWNGVILFLKWIRM